MKSAELNRQLQAIKDLISNTTMSTASNLELQGHWGKYLCVLSAGFLENAISEIYSEFVDNSSSLPIALFTRKTLSKINNPKSSKFVETAFVRRVTINDGQQGKINEGARLFRRED